ncbi:MucR family transcriptional regulator [Methylobacterium planeticum]|uniref:Transcriptional regulator n=1 Tax=Methylobacterium planeticum TaxID=2615211 RepID=A0A6N6MUM4_9HYPH|nr:MucR family transcriptional regulator [Methylobacterium planeticum]KAB1074428.1 transcriptional regulator [Methylobacterium planeticum]
MPDPAEATAVDLFGLTADVVAAYVSNNVVSAADLPALIRGVHAAMDAAANSNVLQAAAPVRPSAAQIRKSITPDHLVSFETGGRFKSLKRHLAKLGLSADAYRVKWGLPADYPLVAPAYSARRSELARQMGLGKGRGGAARGDEP